ncbi:MAG: isoleucine--tRNA ligase [Dehalococcoidia bacterium]|nr:isoleucine--tRNA ligase [Dehalococcoidia bacterium]
MFKPVDTRQSFPKLEEEVLRFWKEHDIFRKSIEQRPADRTYVFYEGPPTANARPGVHHVLSRAFKDLFPRYKTMRGYRVPRKAGWDTHGLPVELEVERELGLGSKPEIEQFGVEEFNRRCRESVFRYVKEWEALTERIGFWVDMENAYITYDNSYIESVWWIVKQLWDNNLLYLDYRSTPHCPRCETSLSDGEVALGYREDTPDPSVFVKFRLTAESVRALHVGALREAPLPDDLPVYVLAWTTTPWTLPGNTALAVKPDAEYAVIEAAGERVIVAAALPEAMPEGGDTVATLRGEDLVGLKYEPLYDPTDWGVQPMAFIRSEYPSLRTFATAEERQRELGVDLLGQQELVRLAPVSDASQVERAYTILGGDFVSLEDGTGVVHIAPAFGGEDFDLGKANGLLFVQPVDLRGRMPDGSPWAGQFVKDADAGIMADLAARNLLLRQETIKHTYPFCWRCDTPLLYYAKPTWYIRTTAVKDRLIAANEQINWYPEHIKHGRFGDWLRNNVDWALSRERYWGTPLPVWRCASCGAHGCAGSRDELRERAVDPAAVEALTDLHRPYIDRIELKCGNCGGVMTRVPEVMDCWFDSGAMPYAQWHYPMENGETFARMFPADFICEAVDQTRGWFYTLHAEAVLLAAIGKVPEGLCYRNVICLGLILDESGRKMSKSLGNAAEPMEVIDAHGADALRWYLYTATRPGEARRFSSRLVAESLRRFLLTLWNTYSFFVTYANLDGWDPLAARVGAVRERPDLDRWVLSELHALVRKVTNGLEEYDPTTPGRAIQDFVEGLSNWYVRRSRRRFWKPALGGAEGSELDADKLAAYQTLYTCLVTVAKLLAPFTPFVAEALYQNLVRSADAEAPESVHLAEWPAADELLIDGRLMDETRTVMRVVSLGRAARSKAGIKVRQPLAGATAFVATPHHAEGLRRFEDQVIEELNVRRLDVKVLGELSAGAVERPKDLLAALPAGAALAEDESGYAVGLDTQMTPELADEGLARELVHRIQNLRKAAGFEISDRIAVYYAGWDRLREVFARHGAYVRAEVLADELVEGAAPAGAAGEEQRVDGETVKLAVKRVG